VLTASDPAPGGGVGTVVELRGERILAAAADGRAAYLFRRLGGDWRQEARLSGDGDLASLAPRTSARVDLAPTGKSTGARATRTLSSFAVVATTMSTCIWNGGDGVWENAGNWSCNAIPGSGDDATIATAGSNVSVNSAVTVHDLTLSGSVNALTVNPSNNGATMTTTGTVSWSAGAINLQNMSTWTNQGTLDIQSDSRQMVPGGADPNVLVNSGTVKKSAGAAGSSLLVNLQSTGTLDAQSGTLGISGTASTYTGGTLTASTGATLSLAGASHTISGTVTGNPTGSVQLDGGSLKAVGGGGTLDLGGQGFRWSNGNVAGGNPLTNAGTFRLVNNNGHQVSATTLVNGAAATMEWSGGQIQLLDAATIDNQGTFDIQVDSTIFTSGTEPNKVVNSGTIEKSAGLGGASIGVVLQNSGTVDAQSGTLSVTGNGSSYTNGVLTASTNATLALSSGTQTVGGTVTGTPAGAVELAGATLQAAGGGGALSLGGTGFRWSSGTVKGANTLTNAGVLSLVAGGTHVIETTTMVNAASGTMKWSGGDIQLLSVATLSNQGTFDILAGGLQFLDSGASPNTVSNSGTFVKSAGGGNVAIPIVFNNLSGGIVEVGGAAGSSLGFSNTFNHASGAILRGNQTVGLGGTVVNAGITAPGTSPGKLTVSGNWSPTSSAVLRIEMQGLTAVTQHDQLAVLGTATLGGSLEVSFLGGYVPAVGDSFVVMTCTTACTGAFTSVSSPPGTHFDVVVHANDVTLVVSGNGVFSDGFESGTKALWNGGSTS
jgi:hypothetical protein